MRVLLPLLMAFGAAASRTRAPGASMRTPGLVRAANLVAVELGEDPSSTAGSEADQCPLQNLALPAAVTTVCLVVALVLIGRHVRNNDRIEGARTVVLLPQFVLIMGASIIVLDSWMLAEAADMEPGDSGQIIGLNWLGAAFGFVSMWAALSQQPTLWKEQPKAICMGGLLCNTFGVLLYLLAARSVEKGANGESVAAILKGVRFVGGIGQGIIAQLMVVSVQSLTAMADMSIQMTRVFFVNTVGIGSGPVVAALAHVLMNCPAKQSSFVAAPTVQLIVNLGGLVGVLLFFPDISQEPLPDKPSELPMTPEPDDRQEADRRRRRTLIFSCMSIFLLRQLVTSGVEVGSALMLERDFDMDRRAVGFLVGLTFFAAFPVRVFHRMLREKGMSLVNQFRLFAGLATAGTLLLLRPASRVLPFGAALILADSIIFPCAFLADGLSYGELMKNVFPEGSLLDKNHSALWCNLLAFSAGRLTGPWMTRWQLEALGREGQDRYALWQMAFCFISLIIFELGVRPGVKAV